MEHNHIKASNGPQFTTCGPLTNHGMNHLPMVLKAGLVSLGVKLKEVNDEQKSKDESPNIESGNYTGDVYSMCKEGEGDVLKPTPSAVPQLHPTDPV